MNEEAVCRATVATPGLGYIQLERRVILFQIVHFGAFLS